MQLFFLTSCCGIVIPVSLVYSNWSREAPNADASKIRMCCCLLRKRSIAQPSETTPDFELACNVTLPPCKE